MITQNNQNNIEFPIGKKIYYLKVFDISTNSYITYFYGEDDLPILLIRDIVLSGGVYVFKDDRIKLSSRAFMNYKSISGTAGTLYYNISDGQIEFRSTSTSDNSTINVMIFF